MVSLQKESEWEKNLEGELCAYLGAMNVLGVVVGETTSSNTDNKRITHDL